MSKSFCLITAASFCNFCNFSFCSLGEFPTDLKTASSVVYKRFGEVYYATLYEMQLLARFRNLTRIGQLS